MGSFIGIDIGNTTVKVGLWQDDHWQSISRLRTMPKALPVEYATLLNHFIDDNNLDLDDIRATAIASVVPSLTDVFSRLAQGYFAIEPLVVTARLKTGITIDVDFPDRVGTDRIVNASAAFALFGGPSIVVDFGTATKFEVISRQGVYGGGSIAPGIDISLAALVDRTALLNTVVIAPPPLPIPRNTPHSIRGGLFWGYVGLFEGMIIQLRDAMEEGSRATIIATGGYAGLFRQYSPAIQRFAPTLTLDGLRLIYSLNVE